MRLFSLLSESDTDFMIGQNNHKTQTENRVIMADRNITLNNTNNPTQKISKDFQWPPQMEKICLHT